MVSIFTTQRNGRTGIRANGAERDQRGQTLTQPEAAPIERVNAIVRYALVLQEEKRGG